MNDHSTARERAHAVDQNAYCQKTLESSVDLQFAAYAGLFSVQKMWINRCRLLIR
jgi:hypothetical protein